jgi:hypothetical protein
MELPTSAETAMNRMFYACNRMRRRLDDSLNRINRNALRTVSRYLGTGQYDYAEFFSGKLLNGRDMPF